MKNFIKHLIITFIVSFIIACIILLLMPLTADAKDNHKMYAMTTVVVEYENDMLFCEDFNGNVWTILVEEESEDWFIGDICSMIMNDNGTPIIYDDTIVSYKYDGFVSNWGYYSDGNGKWGWKYAF